jgi:nitroimidazol reductase NimA-like FMN-containing flavoprotein (pyridoxamine 5'-phosphate oxidase superfamily)
MSGGTIVVTQRPIATMHELSESACWRLVGAAAVGRVAFTAGRLPKIFPVNHWVDRQTIVFRTAWASSLQLKAGAAVAFEVDDSDEMRKIGWSVLLEGQLTAVTDPVEAEALEDLHHESWAPGIRDYWMRIVPTSITGRAITRHHGAGEGT